jgi:acyl carrier protein
VAELHIGGAGLARGYLHRDELTREKFIPDPFNPNPGALLYKTGDLARYLPDGNIECLGRGDHQVKIRGFRIELGEIESVMNQHPAVKSSTVVAREDTPGDKRLVAYLVGRGTVPSLTEMRNFLGKKLPNQMIPVAFVLLDMLPLTPNGKLDRNALPPPDLGILQASTQYAAPHTPTEQFLTDIWAKELGLQKVGIHDNFFDLGGHSLLLVRIQTRLSEKLETKVSIVELFQYPTISSLARHLSQPAAGSRRLQKVRERARLRTETLGRRRQLKRIQK